MSDLAKVNAQIIDTINAVQTATMNPQVVKTSGSGKAFQSVAQSAAIAVQDAADTLRNISTISTTAVGVAMAQILATGDPEGKYEKALKHAQGLVPTATTDFQNIGTAAAAVLSGFPSG
jgi:hypothetical protein